MQKIKTIHKIHHIVRSLKDDKVYSETHIPGKNEDLSNREDYVFNKVQVFPQLDPGYPDLIENKLNEIIEVLNEMNDNKNDLSGLEVN